MLGVSSSSCLVVHSETFALSLAVVGSEAFIVSEELLSSVIVALVLILIQLIKGAQIVQSAWRMAHVVVVFLLSQAVQQTLQVFFGRNVTRLAVLDAVLVSILFGI